MNRLVVSTLLALFIFVADFLLKAYVHACVPPMHGSEFPYGGISFLHGWHGIDFALIHVWNKGAAWGWFSSFPRALLYTRFIMIGGLFSYLCFVRASFFRKLCTLVILTGAICNIIDVFLYSHVIDMFFFSIFEYSYPVFNLADTAIFIGIALLLIEMLVLKFMRFRKPV